MLQYPEFENFVRNHDIICLVESKTDDRDEIKLPWYILSDSKDWICVTI
jgi:hypothetical protein